MITHEEAKEALRILDFHIFTTDKEEYRTFKKFANIVFDYIEQQIENDSAKREIKGENK